MTALDMAPIDRVRAVLERVTGHPVRNGSALCPAHEADGDRHRPSLSVDEGADGKVLIHCQRGCPLADVLAALDLEPGALFPDRPKGQETPVSVYPYRDERGQLLYEVLRYPAKRFAQRRPLAGGGWEWRLSDVRRVIYRLPEVLEAVKTGRPIYICEGEKDVHAVEWAGGVATCNSGGAGKWRPEFADWLTGATVIVVRDQDPPGTKHAADVEASLTSKARRVTVVDPAEGKDAADHLTAGHTLAEWEQQADPDTPARPASIDANHIEPIDWAEFWAAQPPDEDWMAEPLLPARRQIAIFSPPKAGKSLLLLEIAAAKATGRPVLDEPARPPIDVIYIDMEMTEDDLRDRLDDLGYDQDDNLHHLHYYLLADLPPLDTAEGGQTLTWLCQHHNALLVVLDTMARVVKGDENEADTYRAFYRHTGRALKAAAVTLVRLDHAGKDITKGQRGSSSKADDIDIVYRMTVEGRNVILTCTHRRIPWIADTIALTRQDEPLRHINGLPTWLAGTTEVANQLDQLGVPVDATVRTAQTALKANGTGRRQLIVRDALKWRRQHPEQF